ncbi:MULTISPECIES: hypothetical protein [unclassified Yoonia]|uniref:hypothetical protein n=1 Tax=unclassified Yoonia TaxID=2629118 RepID=UPI002AFFB9E1|nr:MULTISPECIES: hypothetical protein [unclassified Yoonia]
MVFWVRLLAVIVMLSGCGGGGGDSPGSGIDPRIARLDIYDAQRIRVLGDPGAGVMGMAPTTSNLPVDGSAQFAGFATLRVEGAQPLVLFGDARLDIDFGASAVSGAMTGFFGTVPGAGVQDFAGEVTVTQGHVARDLRLTYGGALSGGGQQLALSGSMTGAFLGDPATALSAADLDPVVVLNGVLRNGTLVLVTEIVAP